jgi:hypothetical protein
VDTVIVIRFATERETWRVKPVSATPSDANSSPCGVLEATFMPRRATARRISVPTPWP